MGQMMGGGKPKKTLGEQPSPDVAQPNIEGPGGLDDSPRGVVRNAERSDMVEPSSGGGDGTVSQAPQADTERKNTPGDQLSDTAMSSGNPYAMAAGAALKVLGAKAKREKERAAALMNATNAQQSNMSKGAQAMTNVSSGFRL